MVLRHDGGTVNLAPDAEARPFVDGDIMPSVVEQNPTTPRTRPAMKWRTRAAERTWRADHETDRDHLDCFLSGGVSVPNPMRLMERPPQVAANRNVDFVTLTFES